MEASDKQEIWAEELTPEETEALVEKAAQEIHRRGLITPAIMTLEMHKPLAGFIGHASIAAAPFLMPFVGFDFFNNYSRLLSRRENVEKLLRALEGLAAEDRRQRGK